MIEIIFHLLLQKQKPLSLDRICSVFKIYSDVERLELEISLREDSRFVYVYNQSGYELAPLPLLFPDQAIKDVTFSIVDLETTGSIFAREGIIEIALMKVKNGEIIDTYETLVDPQRYIPRIISNLTGIQNHHIKGQPKVDQALEVLFEKLENTVFVAHDVNFDFFFIAYEAFKHRLKIPQIPIVCSLKLAEKCLPDVTNKGLKGLAVHYDYEGLNAHNAMSDVEATNHFFQHMLQDMHDQEFRSLHDLLDLTSDLRRATNLRKHLYKYFKNETIT